LPDFAHKLMICQNSIENLTRKCKERTGQQTCY